MGATVSSLSSSSSGLWPLSFWDSVRFALPRLAWLTWHCMAWGIQRDGIPSMLIVMEIFRTVHAESIHYSILFNCRVITIVAVMNSWPDHLPFTCSRFVGSCLSTAPALL